MKKQSNIKILKELVNSSALERVDLRTRGAQAYGLVEGEEYTVVIAYAKQGNRYYFIDREGRRFLASHYDRAEILAGELLEILANDRAAAMHAADQVEASVSVLVCADLLPLFFEECDRRNIHVTSTAAGVDDLGRMLTRYDLVQDAEPAQQSDNNDTQSDESNEGNQTPAEPSRFTQTAAKVAASVKTYAAKTARRAALLLSLLVVLILAFSAAFGCVAGLLAIFDAFGITGSVRFFLSLLVMFGPALELGINVECNALAVVARLFPGSFPGCMPFEIFSFWRRMFRA